MDILLLLFVLAILLPFGLAPSADGGRPLEGFYPAIPTPSVGGVLHPISGSRVSPLVPPHWSGVMRSSRYLVLYSHAFPGLGYRRLPSTRLLALSLSHASSPISP